MPGISFASYVFGAGPGMSLDSMFSTSFYAGFVFENPKWKLSDLDFDKDIALTEEKVGGGSKRIRPRPRALSLPWRKVASLSRMERWFAISASLS